MYIIIVGLGGIGRSLVKQAVEHGNNVVVIDQNESRCSEILEHYDILAITGNATDKSTLEEAGIDRTDAFVATTSDDAVNLMTCWLAKRFHVPNVVAIVNQTAHSEIFQGGRCQDQRESGRSRGLAPLLLDRKSKAPAACFDTRG